MPEPSREQNIGPEFLQRKYKLSDDHNYSEKIQNYLDQLSRIINPPPLESHPNFDRKQRNLNILKRSLYDQVIIKPEEVPENYFQSIIQRHEEEGRPIESIPKEIKQDLINTLIKDQKESLDTWIDYLSSPDAKYPDWFKYYAIRSVLVMGRYDKEKRKFFERSKTGKSLSPFPELIRDALSFVSDAVEAKQKGTLGNLEYGYGIKPEEKAEFEKLLREGDPNFSKLYAWAIDKITPISEELLQQTKGEWIKFPQGSDPKKVTEALAQYGTGWCIRGEGTATSYLKTSDLEIYFSNDQNDKPTVPRIVIVTKNGQINEVRGVAKQEHWDPYITDVVEQKLAELPDGQKFKKRVEDMQKMTAIHQKSFSVDKKTGIKTFLNPELTKEELKFLYEIDNKIEGFGYRIPDPRIKEILDKRNAKIDVPIVLECQPSEIAWSKKELNNKTKSYIGLLFPGIFKDYKNLENIFTSFPEGKIRREPQEAGGKSNSILEKELQQNKINVITYAQQIMKKSEFTTLKSRETFDLIHLKVSDLGFTTNPTTKELYERAKLLGLDLCPPEIGPELRLKYKDQPLGEWKYIAMKPIIDSGGHPDVFELVRDDGGLWLLSRWTNPDGPWSLVDEMVFCLRK